MSGRDRIRPLLLFLAAGGAVLLARLWWIQVHEREVWSIEAARLVHVGHVLPYRRGEITDARGTVLAVDRGAFELVLRYRDFRRGHPLGEVAHARSLLEGRAVPLAEAAESLAAGARALVGLTSADLAAFVAGEAVESGPWRLPSCADPRAEERTARAADLRFYLCRLLDLSPRQWTAVRKQGQRREPEAPFHALAAAERSRTSEAPWTPDGVLADMDARLARSMDQLRRLARLLARDEAAEDGGGDPLAALIGELEDSRRLVEDATASKLFLEATRFAPGRIEPDTLLGTIELDWIRHLLAWDEARLAEWARTARDGWVAGWRDGYALPRLRADLVLNTAYRTGPGEVLDRLAAIFAPEGAIERALDGDPPDWRALDSLAVFAALDGILHAELPRELRAARRTVLPIQDPALRAASRERPGDWSLVDRTVTPSAAEAAGEPGPGARLAAHLERCSSADLDAVYEILRRLAGEWEDGFQRNLAAALASLRETAGGTGELSAGGRLVLREELRERAVERAAHLLKDYGTRPRPLLGRHPAYDVVYLLTRYADWFPGIEARAAAVRELPVHAGDPGPLAAALVGTVSAVTIGELQAQREDARALRRLRNLPDRTAVEEEELRRLVGRVLLPDEIRGVAGVEGFFDPELRGTNGYEEQRGLQETFGGGGERVVRAAEDGEPVVLTLEAAVQRAAERTLAHPPLVREDEKFDAEWARNPVGAIVAITPEGDVIAAASEPTAGSELAPGASGQRASPLERTLGKPGFQPPGSVIKPLVAVYALDRGGLDPGHEVTCGPIERGGAGYVDIRCWSEWGHGPVSLERALVESCNSYFAWLGETYRDDQLHDLAAIFGFGAPTGVRSPPPGDSRPGPRLGLAEAVPAVFRPGGARPSLSDYQRRAAGNGLAVVEVTPMQLARAYAALATGVLPSLRLARSAGGRELPPGPARRLPFAPASLDFVRRALADVVARETGTAHRALAPERLGVAIAAKTGSADITSRMDEDQVERRVHKHTWVAGWVPARDPALVFVVFVHDTMTTSSHGAVYVASAFLDQPEVRAWLAERGVALAPPAAEEGR
ncbi:MAG: penicillin-binding transpeptidase domain-containing protein [Planctomycetota bacterium]